MYVLIKGDEDGNHMTFIEEPIHEFLASAIRDYGIKQFEDLEFLKQNSDPNYWADDVAVLAKLEIVVPKPVTSQWSIE